MYPIVDLVEHQTIAAVQAEADVDDAINSDVNIVFLLTGSIFNVKELVDRIKQAGKCVFLHMEFIEGIAPDKSGVAYVAQYIAPTGIISTRSNLIRVAKEMGLMAIQRIFLIDRNAVIKGIKVVEQSMPDAVEVMPGVMPRVIREMTDLTPLPIIAGGLVGTKQEIDDALAAGALAVSVGTKELWY
ncbi:MULTISPECIES: glycerol-3-phosphate responsive antiterminator [Bacillales]|jgi:glycerol uptake operon antiterminator|uniref:Glycerol uptake operon antiterminator regulatory protein n=1 Tax=Brevibacillus aydinogluensis TaxID=927786 RepID=A0AA48M9P1_9BACL|nr:MULTISPECIES: glycerol-3-phosphate responsive antiterminator [Bacillales]REK61127.1 MAG: glycerol-3-phosphate responsive antiterminator [Brevibacillus sp.]MBR8661105.1 glycerol-3-phosphate responsive antiterminator [Brevibacillus sp. NL20B1]MDT3417571.1 glycerol uptake operon antiterminator [Brevibacillus aydinogluensis]NNV03651.1 glycerol-3-phosphate responsive antiterminator [Brevibacillus sp. MCWH]UFJ62938.1 glycerol-3-phosphate responsive antiterminator [Anoxybacillus sediminis]